MVVLVEVGRETSGVDAGEMGYTVKTGKIAKLSPNDAQDLLDMMAEATRAVERALQAVPGTEA